MFKLRRRFRFVSNKVFAVTLLIFVCAITIGYATLSQSLSISGVTSLNKVNWDIHFENVQVKSGSVTPTTPATIGANKTSITFETALSMPGDYYEFTVDVVNAGSADAMIGDLNITPTLTDAQKAYMEYSVTYEGGQEIKAKDLLPVNASYPIVVRISYKDVDLSLIPDNQSPITSSITLNYVQKDGETTDVVISKTLTQLLSTNANASTGLDFYYSASDTNGKGIYTWQEDGTDIYYYRGEVYDNNVVFNNMCWKIVRTTKTGGTKLIYNGTYSEDNGCNNTGTASQIGTSAFNSSYTSPADVGYKYGSRYTYKSKLMDSITDAYVYGNDVSWDGSKYSLTDTTTLVGSSWSTDRTNLAKKYHYTCFNTTGECTTVNYIHYFGSSSYAYYLELSNGKDIEQAKTDMFTNTTDSTIKTTIENWYASNLTGYTQYFEDFELCNDRTFYSGSLKGKDTDAGESNNYFNVYGRLVDAGSNNVTPSLSCSNSNDKLTVANGTLVYPVGLLTADEVDLAGFGWSGNQNTNYLYTGRYWWLASPFYFYYFISYEFLVHYDGALSHGNMNYVGGVRPVISLQAGIKSTSGSGTASDPYRVID